MKARCFLWSGAFILSLVSPALSADANEDIKRKIIELSIQSYPGNCPCPYNRDRAGRKCGKRSAYSKPGGYSPICYISDVTDEMVKEHKRMDKK
ncbi:conserved hypothetical protein [Hahella chejuensis KCTC 2396]|uniref:Uncharacterized protein n=1 Tax=Hahella chejuensis (strain KCTC 2396) TaxID=349521 RepID=Q2S8I6_HAHCH|nr:conserved hypothetical protein [Hahella chejuensis KCTC 2396]